jgi:hypothetical protein
MKLVLGHYLAGLTMLSGAAVFASACVKDDSTIFVDEVLAPQLVTPGAACMFTSDPTQTFLFSGELDVAFAHQYTAAFLLANQIVPRGDPSQPQTETSYVQIQGAVVRITDSQGNQLSTYTRLASATIPPAVGSTPSYSPIEMTILDSNTIESSAVLVPVEAGGTRRLITYTKFFGQTLGGVSVETGEYEFPVDVCFGCLIRFSAADIDPNIPGLNCGGAVSSSAAASTTSALPVPCVAGQDDAIDCSECLSVPACLGTASSGIADAGTGG